MTAAVEEALRRLEASVALLESAVARRLDAERSHSDLETELEIMRDDRARLAAELDGVWALTRRDVTQAARTGVMGPGAMMIKYAYSELRQRLGELSMRILERDALAVDVVGEFVEERLRTLALTIAAGTSQIQKNIIGERVLGLPKEPVR